MRNTFSKYLLEIACFNVESCLIAQQASADRVEFCADYSKGGITPAQADILEVRKRLYIPLHIIIRPRGGNFIYSSEEIEIMKRDISFCKENHITGIVLGVLNFDNTINVKANKELVKLAKPMSVTFHRAIDECPNLEKAFEKIIEIGFKRVLTSGGKKSALEGIETLQICQEKFGEKIIIIPGGGIRSHNIKSIANETQCNEFHSAALTDNTGVSNLLEIERLRKNLL